MTLVSGYGTRAQWFRNVRAHSAVRMWTGRIRGRAGQATVMSDDEARRRLETYRRRHRHGAAALGRILGIPELTSTEPLPVDIGASLPLVEVHYESHRERRAAPPQAQPNGRQTSKQ